MNRFVELLERAVPFITTATLDTKDPRFDAAADLLRDIQRALATPEASRVVEVACTFQRWVDEHQEELKAHRGRYMAISLKEGILASAVSDEEMETMISALPESSEEIYVCHADMILEEP